MGTLRRSEDNLPNEERVVYSSRAGEKVPLGRKVSTRTFSCVLVRASFIWVETMIGVRPIT